MFSDNEWPFNWESVVWTTSYIDNIAVKFDDRDVDMSEPILVYERESPLHAQRQ